MLNYFETLQDTSGNALVGATCTVTNFPSGSAALIYAQNSTGPGSIANGIVTADATGQVSFFVPDGAYILTYKFNGTTYKVKSPVQMLDPMGFVLATETGAANAYVVTSTLFPLSLQVGMKLQFLASNANTGASTLNLNSTGAQPLTQVGGSPIAAGVIPAGGIMLVEWDGAHWQILGSQSQPFYQTIAAENTAGVTVVNPLYPVGYVDRYVTNTNPGTTDTSTGFNAAFKVARIAGVSVRYGATAPYGTSFPINYTTAGGPNQNGIATLNDGCAAMDAVNQSIILNHNGHGFDCTGTIGLVFERLGVTNGAAFLPQTAFFQARNVSGGSVGVSRFIDCNVQGKFTVAPYYNFGAEDDQIFGGWWENDYQAGAAAVAIWTSHNIKALTSTFQTLPAVAGCTDHKVFGGEWYRNGANAADDVIYLDLIESLKMFGPWMHCASGAASGRSLVYNDHTNGASSFCTLQSVTGEQTTFVAKYGVAFGNEAVQTSQNWKIADCKFPNATNSIACLGTNATLANFAISAVYDPVNHGIAIPGTLQDSRLDASTPLTIGTSLRNLLTGDTSSWTITTRNKDSWTETASTNRTFAPGIVTGVNGWTAVGAITQRGKMNYVGGANFFSMLLAGATTLAAGAGATIVMPFTATDEQTATVVDDSNGNSLGNAFMNGNILTFPTAIVATGHSITVQGMAFVS